MGNEQRDVRVSKVRRMREQGIQPYGERFERTHTLAQARSLPLETEGVRVAGRVMTVRAFGKLVFATLRDHTGTLQIALQQKNFDPERFDFFKKQVDIGDFVGVEGSIFKTKMGEITVDVRSFELLSKALRPLPEKWHGVQDKEILYRQRYLDLIMNEGTMERFVKRTRIIKTLRDFLDSSGFIEVETPVLQTKPSGAIANPFVTHHQALDMPLYLRIAPETYLKRLIAGGFDRVYEFARSFRNEGMDPSHLQDFTLLEYYAAYWNYRDNMAFTERLIKHVLLEVNGSLRLTCQGIELDFDGEWEVVSLRDLLQRDTGIDIDEHPDAASLQHAVRGAGIDIQDMDKMGHGALIDNLYKKVSRPGLKGPLFLINHPIELSPLARRSDTQPGVTDRFQLVVNGWEIVNAYSELVDPLDQRARLEEQARLRSAGDTEAMVMDEDFLTAMEHGMPPMSGWGMGVDRFICLLTDQENLRDVILCPLMKPTEGAES